jgi:hypothetical protein
LYYSNKLLNAQAIRHVMVWEQGRGIINNVGAMRTHPLAEWGMYDTSTHNVYQWDGETLSPVVHQWDRDKHLHSYMLKRHQEWAMQWSRQKRKNSKNDTGNTTVVA